MAGCLDGVGALLAGTANVIMQLSRPAVGYGVLESKVESGQVMRHPLKRFRTTFTYLAVAMLGDEQDRADYRAAVNTAHAQVRSDESSPVAYNAFDPALQLWVAACLYWGAVDLVTRMHGPIPADVLDEFHVFGARMGTTLQVKPELWPADREAFARYWAAGVAQIRLDEPVRQYLTRLMTRSYLPWPLRASGWLSTWVTTGFLPEPFRVQMQLSWTERDELRFDRLLRTVGWVSRGMPGVVRRFPFNFFLWDMRRRVRRGTRLV